MKRAVAEVLNKLIHELVENKRTSQVCEDEVADVLYDLIDKVIDKWMIDEQPTQKRLNKCLRCAGVAGPKEGRRAGLGSQAWLLAL